MALIDNKAIISKSSDIFQQFVDLICQSLDTEVILGIAAEKLAEYFLADRCFIVLYDKQEHSFRIKLSGQYCRQEGIIPVIEEEIPFSTANRLQCHNPDHAPCQPLPGQMSNEAMLDYIREYQALSQIHYGVYFENWKRFIEECPRCAQGGVEVIRHFHSKYDIHAIMALEIGYRGTQYGSVVLHQCTPNKPWSDEDLTMLRYLASCLGMALHQADLYQQEQYIQQELELQKQRQIIVSDLSKKALQGLDLQAIMDLAVQTTASALKLGYAAALELLPDHHELLVRSMVGWPEEYHHHKYPAQPIYQAGYTLYSSEPVVLEDIQTETRFEVGGVATKYGIQSGLSVIIHSQQTPYGVLILNDTEKRNFTPEEIGFVQSVANVLGIAIERHRSDMKYQRIVDSNIIGVLFSDSHGHITDANQAFLDLMGYHQDDLHSSCLKLEQLIPQQWHTDYEALWHTLKEQETSSPIPIQLFKKDGTPLDVLVGGAVLDTFTRNYVIYLVDMSKQKQIERNLARTLKREQLIKELVHTISQTFEINEILSYTARKMVEYLEVDRCTVIRYSQTGNQFSMMLAGQYCRAPQIKPIADEDLNKLVQSLQNLNLEAIGRSIEVPQVVNSQKQYLAELDQTMALEETLQHFDSSDALTDFVRFMKELVLEYDIKAVMRVGVFYRGVPCGSISVNQCLSEREWKPEELELLQDIATHVGEALYQSELYQNEQRARQDAQLANQRKSQFLARMSHELRTPLNAIIGYSQMLESGMTGVLTEKQQKYTQNVVTSGQHLLGLVNEILDLSKIEAGKLALQLEALNLDQCISEKTATFKPMADNKQIDLQFELDPALKSIQADQLRFNQILMNLLSNAIKFTPEGGSVTVRMFPSADRQWFVCTVSDTGIGIPANQLPEIFNEFLQVDHPYSRKQQGTGLGLTVTKRLVELHGGSISAESVEGQGSTFTFTIPLLIQQPESADSPEVFAL